MAFLDNSGDIILDAVLTDTGRHRLAKGDGTFRITKFALGDDEINYELYDKNNASGSAYYDLSILQTPVLEAFTNNTSLMKSKLVSIPRTNLLYLPVLKLNTLKTDTKQYGSTNSFLIAVDQDTENKINNAASTDGVLFGNNPNGDTSMVRIDQGLDTTELPKTFPLDADLVETQYIVEIDNRLGQIYSSANNGSAKVSFIDDDQVASYYFSLNTDADYVKVDPNAQLDINNDQIAIAGPRGTLIEFKIKASIDLNSSTFLFTQLGGDTVSYTFGSDTSDYYYIDTTIRVSGATTGYRLDIPVRFIKLND